MIVSLKNFGLTVDVKDDVVRLDVPMDVMQVGVDVVNCLASRRTILGRAGETTDVCFGIWPQLI